VIEGRRTHTPGEAEHYDHPASRPNPLAQWRAQVLLSALLELDRQL
jgi:hypothetical protein